MSVDVKTVSEWASSIRNENMDEIWMMVEHNDLGVYSLFGRQGDDFYISGDRCWNPIYRKTYEDFLQYVEDFGVFDKNSLVKVK